MAHDITPLMAQYRKIKKKYHDCVLLFRVGDFYETFYEDAVDVSSILNIALTSRDKKKENPVPLAGVPFHAAENYITRLLSAGKKVAVCEQVEDPAKAKGLVKREVVEVLTPGTAMNPQLLEEKEHNYCLSIYHQHGMVGVAVIDVSTGDFMCGEERMESLHYLLQGKNIKEILCNQSIDQKSLSELAEGLGNPFINKTGQDYYQDETISAAQQLQFSASAREILEGLRPLERIASGSLLHHCQQLRGGALPQVVEVKKLKPVPFLALDDETIGNLELFRPLRGGDPKATLIRVIDYTLTPMGGRKIREWLQKPLASVPRIERRLDAVNEIYRDALLHEDLAVVLRNVADIQRLAARIASCKAIPRELIALRTALEKIPAIKKTLLGCKSEFIREMLSKTEDHKKISATIEKAIVMDPPGHLRDGGVIKKGFSEELDAFIDSNEGAKKWIADLERREREKTSIGCLKVGYNKVFGYYIEIPKTHERSAPAHYLAKQTLVNAQRYYTPELKDREQLILETEEKRIECEQKIFDELCGTVSREMQNLQRTSDCIASIDVIQSLALVAKKFGYKRPVIDESNVLEIAGGRHPVLEHAVKEAFVPNDIRLDPERKQFALITGPNMSGKSTFLRQVALITILAQMGSFVPAGRARIGVVDKIFTRVGATDRLSRGQSTFLVEMDETAHILNHMTNNSLVLLDEIGRGTSTFDGLSIAWAVTEYILQGIKAHPKTLFATHFHELTQLRNTYPRLVNLKITIKEWEGGIVFLRKVVPGTSERSYGIHAARVAGLPEQIITRAGEILHGLELRRALLYKGVELSGRNQDQYSLFSQHIAGKELKDITSSTALNKLMKLIDNFEINASTPLDALEFIRMLKDRFSAKP